MSRRLIFFCEHYSLIFALLRHLQVASVVGRAELLSAICYLTCLLIHWQSRHRHRTALTLIIAFVGFLCKEQSLTALLVLALSDLIAAYTAAGKRQILSSPPSPLYHRKLSPPHRHHHSPVKTQQRRRTPVILLAGFFFASFFRVWINGRTGSDTVIGAPTFNRFDNPASVESKHTQLLTYSYLAAFHYFVTLFPANLACDWTHGSLPLVTSVMQPQNVMTLAFVAICVAIVYRCRRDAQVSDERRSVLYFFAFLSCRAA